MTILLRCEPPDCAAVLEPRAESAEEAREVAAASGWSYEDGRDWCGFHTLARARQAARASNDEQGLLP